MLASDAFAKKRIVVLHNTDYDAELTDGTGVDVSAVQASAMAIADAIRGSGASVELVGVAGVDVFTEAQRIAAAAPDLVFNLCESLCRDSRNEVAVPAILDVLGLCYTGSNALALASCLHKDRAKDILRGRGVPTPPALVLCRESDLHSEALMGLDYPWFLKLVHEDASVGIEASNVVHDRDDLIHRAGEMLAEWKQPVLAERYVDGREVNVGLVGNGEGLCILPVHEIDFAGMPADRPRIVSYAAKWDEKHVDYAGTKPVLMRDLAAPLEARLEQVARAAWTALGLRDYGRVDMRIDRDGQPWVIDVNPNCDISPDAGAARAAQVMGQDYPAFIRSIAEAALRRREAAC